MQENLQFVHGKLAQASCAEDVFGGLDLSGDELETHIKTIYHKFVKIAHPDRYQEADDKELAHDTFQALVRYHTAAETKLKNDTYGQKLDEKADEEAGEFVVQTRKDEYLIK